MTILALKNRNLKSRVADDDRSAFSIKRLLDLFLNYFRVRNVAVNLEEISKYNFDEKKLRIFHVKSILELINSHNISIDGFDSNFLHFKALPRGYQVATSFLEQLLHLLQRSNHSTAFSIVRSILKKEGIRSDSNNSISFDHFEDNVEGNSRSLVSLKRRVERALSCSLLFMTAYHLALSRSSSEDILYFSRMIVDRCPSQDRHLHLLLFTRTCVASESISAAQLMKTRFLTVLREKYGIERPSWAARLLFPFASACARAYRSYWSSSGEGRSGTGGSEGDWEDDVFPLLAFCMEVDRESLRDNTWTGAGDDLLSSVRKMIVDKISFSVINTAQSLGLGTSLGEGVRHNTLAMELLSFEEVAGFKAANGEMETQRMLAEVGCFLTLLGRCARQGRQRDAGGRDVEGAMGVMSQLKKLLTLFSAMRYLPSSHSAVRAVEVPLGIPAIRFGPPSTTRSSPSPPSRLSSSLSSSGTRSDLDEQLFFPAVSAQSPAKSTTKNKWMRRSGYAESPGLGSEGGEERVAEQEDELFWGIASSSARSSRSKGRVPGALALSEAHAKVLSGLDDTLTDLLAELLQVQASVLRTERARDELSYVFSWWRRPQLLLDFLLMHAGCRDTQTLFRRFLKALLGVGADGETVEDIRFKHPANR